MNILAGFDLLDLRILAAMKETIAMDSKGLRARSLHNRQTYIKLGGLSLEEISCP